MLPFKHFLTIKRYCTRGFLLYLFKNIYNLPEVTALKNQVITKEKFFLNCEMAITNKDISTECDLVAHLREVLLHISLEDKQNYPDFGSVRNWHPPLLTFAARKINSANSCTNQKKRFWRGWWRFNKLEKISEWRRGLRRGPRNVSRIPTYGANDPLFWRL